MRCTRHHLRQRCRQSGRSCGLRARREQGQGQRGPWSRRGRRRWGRWWRIAFWWWKVWEKKRFGLGYLYEWMLWFDCCLMSCWWGWRTGVEGVFIFFLKPLMKIKIEWKTSGAAVFSCWARIPASRVSWACPWSSVWMRIRCWSRWSLQASIPDASWL